MAALGGCFQIFVLLFVFNGCGSQVTTPPSTAPPEEPISTPEATTVPPPQTPATEINANTDLALCTCDLTANGCDVECCCDPDCSVEDVAVFSHCIDQYTQADDRTCIRSTVMFRENVPYTIDESNPDYFCVYTDNNEQRNYFEIPSLAVTEQTFDQYLSRYGDWSFKSLDTQTTALPTTYYQSGEPVYTIYDSLALGFLGLPVALTTNECMDTNPAAYLYDQVNECVRPISDLAVQCQTLTTLDANTYYQGFKVLANPSVFTALAPNDTGTATTAAPEGTTEAPESTYTTLVDLYSDNATMLYVVPTGPHTCTGPDGLNTSCPYEDTLPSPTYQYDATRNLYYCNNVVTKVEYTLTQNGTVGLTNVAVRFTLADIAEDNLPLIQEFSTHFLTAGEVPGFERSGNPGYQISQPLLAGQLITYEDPERGPLQAIQLDGSSSNWLTMVTSTVTGDCISEPNNRVPVTFGEEMRSGCNLRVTLEDMSSYCELLQSAAVDALVGPNRPTHVATFGNTELESVGDWIPILVENEPSGASASSTQPGVCVNMVLGMHIEIIYANVGALGNPQAKVIGVAYRYDAPQDIRFQCVGPYCQPGTESTLQQSFQVSSSVGFVDASQPAVAVDGESPQIQAKLPGDFFFPFS